MSMGAGMATSIIGTELQGWAAMLAKWEMFEQYKKELQRQEGFRNEATGNFNMRVGTAGSDTAKQQLDAGMQDRMGRYNAIQSIPLATTGPSGGDQKRQAAVANLLGQQRANLGKYSDWGLQQAIANINTQRSLNQVTDKAGGQARVFPYRMYEAQHSWDKLAQAGQAISSLGGGGGGGSGGGNPPSPYSDGSNYWSQTAGGSFNPGYFPQGDYNMNSINGSQFAGGGGYGNWVVG